ncbi:MAG TPA: BTAD domain-containing putative transcriptional regulator [Actinospica sp.]|nr:BTAD domain-containing putative transcriptional regulator [Actinospica sp.]
MHFSLLGPLRVRADGADVPVRGTLRRTLLAALLLHPDTVVSADHLSELLWGEGAKAVPTAPLYNQLMRLRQALGDDGDLIRAVPPGYLIHVAPADLDLTEFTDLCAQARDAAATSDWLSSAKLYTSALALWRGRMLSDIPALHGHPAIQQFAENRLVALQGRIEADLNLGRHGELVDELRALTDTHPLREAFHAQLMLALYRAGRRTDAVDVYRALDRATIEGLGVEPGAAIQALHTAILNSAPSLDLDRPRPSVPAPRQLPADTRLFTGRHTELDELTSLAAEGSAASGTVVISAINGMGGVGKTALAVRAAHRLAEHYPDGQLFIDLHGYSANLDPVAPEDALDYLLRSLGVPPQSIPGDLDARTALYRSRLADTRTLILLDNAADASQILPLLPAAPDCLVLVTSRNRLTSLDEAHILALDVLPHADAVALLRDVAGPIRAAELDAHPNAVAELITLCAHTPLAIRIVAARLRHHRHLSVESLNAELREEADRLAHIQDGDRDLTSIFNASLRNLPAPAERLFRLLGLIPGPDFDAYAAAHLAATDLRTAQYDLDTLRTHNLLIQQSPNRYRLHDLLRAHARTLAAEDPTAAAAVTRLGAFYVATASAIEQLVNKGARPRVALAPAATDPVIEITRIPQARIWRDTERANLLAFITMPGVDVTQRDMIIEAITGYLNGQGPWSVAADLQRMLIESARRQGDRAAEANALSQLGGLHGNMGNFDDSFRCLRAALSAFQELGDESGVARTLNSIGDGQFKVGEIQPALEAKEKAAAVYRGIDQPRSYADTIFGIGVLRHGLADNAAAHDAFSEAAAMYRELDLPLGQANVMLIDSRTAYARGDFDAVQPMLHQGLALARITSNKMASANLLQEIARQQLLVGEYSDASRLLDDALKLHLELGFTLGEGNVYWERGRIAFAHGRHRDAKAWFTRSLEIFVALGTAMPLADAKRELARVHHVTGDLAAVQPLLDEALRLHIGAEYPVGEAEVRNGIAGFRADVDGPEAGLGLYQEALAVAVRAEHPLERARALEGMGRCEVRLGAVEAGSGHLREAVELYGRMRVVEYAAAAAYLAGLESAAAGEEQDQQADQ